MRVDGVKRVTGRGEGSRAVFGLRSSNFEFEAAIGETLFVASDQIIT